MLLRITWSSLLKVVKNQIHLFKMSATTPIVFRDLDSVIDVLTKPENKVVDGVQELLQIYETAQSTKDKFNATGEVKKHPLIILEGLDGSGKSTVGSKFAKKINGVKWQTPPTSIQHLRHITDKHSDLFAAYYSLGNYIAALEVQLQLRNTPVVMDRYWHSTAAFGIAQAVHDNNKNMVMPPKGDKIYQWPEDLFKPDIVIFLDVAENVRLERISRRKEFSAQEDLLCSSEQFRNNVIMAYKNMVDPGVTFINGNRSFKGVFEELFTNVTPLLHVE